MLYHVYSSSPSDMRYVPMNFRRLWHSIDKMLWNATNPTKLCNAIFYMIIFVFICADCLPLYFEWSAFCMRALTAGTALLPNITSYGDCGNSGASLAPNTHTNNAYYSLDY